MLGLLLRFCLVFGCGCGWFSFGGAVWVVCGGCGIAGCRLLLVLNCYDLVVNSFCGWVLMIVLWLRGVLLCGWFGWVCAWLLILVFAGFVGRRGYLVCSAFGLLFTADFALRFDLRLTLCVLWVIVGF